MCSGLLTSSAKGASAARASAARGACTSSRTLESLCRMSAFSGLVATCLLPGRRRIRGPFSCRATIVLGQQVAGVPQGTPERRIRSACHHQVPNVSPHAVLAGPQQSSMFSYLSPEERVPANHPLRPIRLMVDDALKALSPSFSRLYSAFGRPSIPPEKLLRALLLQVLYTVRSERMLMEQL